jgi:hypothetical protein
MKEKEIFQAKNNFKLLLIEVLRATQMIGENRLYVGSLYK